MAVSVRILHGSYELSHLPKATASQARFVSSLAWCCIALMKSSSESVMSTSLDQRFHTSFIHR
jgi:hypothetical protein